MGAVPSLSIFSTLCAYLAYWVLSMCQLVCETGEWSQCTIGIATATLSKLVLGSTLQMQGSCFHEV